MEEHFAWEIPIYKLNLLLGGAFRVGNFYLQTQLQRFVWEIPIYKLNWSVSCGKFLFTKLKLERFVWEISIYKLN